MLGSRFRLPGNAIPDSGLRNFSATQPPRRALEHMTIYNIAVRERFPHVANRFVSSTPAAADASTGGPRGGSRSAPGRRASTCTTGRRSPSPARGHAEHRT